MKVLILGHRDVAELLPMAECVEVIEETFRTLARGDVVLPLRQIVAQPDKKGMLGLMPAYLGTPRAIGAKVITVFPANREAGLDSHQGTVLIFECDHGCLLGMVDAGSITAIRTAAATGVATRALAREDASTLAILGSGTQASMHLDAMRTVRPISRVRVWSRTSAHAHAFAAAHASPAFTIDVFKSAREAVDGADIVCTTTPAREPILEGSWLVPGMHINAIGSSVPGFRELDADVPARSRVYVDRRESAMNEADDLRIPMQEGRFGPEHILGEVGEILLGTVQGRTSPRDITLFKSLGIAIEDVASAHAVYTQGVERGIGTWVDFGAERHE